MPLLAAGDTRTVDRPTWWWIPSAIFAAVLLVIALAGGASIWLSFVIAAAIFAGSLITADSQGRILREPALPGGLGATDRCR